MIIYLPIHLVKLEKLGIVSEMGKPYNLNFKVAFLKKIMLFGVAFDLKKNPLFLLLLFTLGDDEFLGRASMSTATVSERGEIQADWAQLEDVESGKIFWALSWLPATLNKSFLQDGKILKKYVRATVSFILLFRFKIKIVQ